MLKNSRPVFKGVTHTLASMIYCLVGWYLTTDIPSGLYFSSMIFHFTTSAYLHCNIHHEKLLFYRKLDHIAIFIYIAAVYNLLINRILHDISGWTIGLLFFGTIVGIYIRIYYTDLPNKLIALPYMICGWSILMDIKLVVKTIYYIPVTSTVFIFGGLCYTVGGLIYISRYPDPWPKYIGFHEVFHMLSVIGSACFTVSVFYLLVV